MFNVINEVQIVIFNFINFVCGRNNVSEVIFVPYAKVNGDYDGYTKMMADAIGNLGKLFNVIVHSIFN